MSYQHVPRCLTRNLQGWLRLGTVCLAGLASVAFGLTPVSEPDARAVAQQWVEAYVCRTGAWAGEAQPAVQAVTSLYYGGDRGTLVGYAVAVSPAGYVIVPAVRELPPVKASSDTATFTLPAAPDSAESFLLRSLAASIGLLQQAEAQGTRDAAATADNVADWERVLVASASRDPAYTGVSGIRMAVREPLSKKAVFSGTFQFGGQYLPYPTPLAWGAGFPFNQKCPLVTTIPEEIWIDRDATGYYTAAADADDDHWILNQSALRDGSPGTVSGELFFYDMNEDGTLSQTYSVSFDAVIYSELLWIEKNGVIGYQDATTDIKLAGSEPSAATADYARLTLPSLQTLYYDADPDGNGPLVANGLFDHATEGLWLEGNNDGRYEPFGTLDDMRLLDSNGLWDTISTSRVLTGNQIPLNYGGLYYYDNDDNDGTGNGVYTITSFDPIKKAVLSGENIWRDEKGGQPTKYDEGIDTRIYPPLGTSGWATPQDGQGYCNGLYYTKLDDYPGYTYERGYTHTTSTPVRLAEIMRFYEYPDTGVGTHTYMWPFQEYPLADLTIPLTVNYAKPYVWAKMPLNGLFDYTLTGDPADPGLPVYSDEERSNVQQLIYDVAVALEEDLQRGSSRLSLTNDGLQRFADHFRYNHRAIELVTRKSVANDAEWFARIQGELDAQRLVPLRVFTLDGFFDTVLVDGYDKTAGTINMFQLHMTLGGEQFWYSLDNIGGPPYDYPAYSDVMTQDIIANVIPTRTKPILLTEFFRNTTNQASMRTALADAANRYGRQFQVLAYPTVLTDTEYSRMGTDTQSAVVDRVAAYGVDTGAAAMAFVNGPGGNAVTAGGNDALDTLRVRAEVERQRLNLSKYRIVGECVLGKTPVPEQKPVFKADVYVTRLDEDMPESETLTLRVALAESDGGNNPWVLRDFLYSSSIELGYGQTKVFTIPAFVRVPAIQDWANCQTKCQVIAWLERQDGTMVQAVRLDSFSPGPNYKLDPDLSQWRPLLVNQPPQPPAQVVLTQQVLAQPADVDGDGNDDSAYLQAVPVGASDPDGDGLIFSYTWYGTLNNGSFQTVTTTSPLLTSGFVTGDVWQVEVRVKDIYYDQAPANIKAKLAVTPVLSNPLLVVLDSAPPGNAAPSVPTFAALVPSNPSVGEQITCLAGDTDDPEGDVVSYVYAWSYQDSVDGGETWATPWTLAPAYVEASLPWNATQYADEVNQRRQWRCAVSARDFWGASSAPVEAAAVTVTPPKARAPSAPAYVSLGPAQPSYISTLQCSIPTGVNCLDPYQVYYRWWKRVGDTWRPTAFAGSMNLGVYDTGEAFDDLNNNGVRDTGESYYDTDGNNAYDIGEPFTDGNNNGEFDLPEPYTDSNGNHVYDAPETYTDADGSGDYDAGESFRDSGVMLGMTQDDIGVAYRCEVFAQNTVTGANGPSVFSNEVLVRNFAPSAPGVSLAPRNAKITDTITCNVSGSEDNEDGVGGLRYYYDWFVNGQSSGIAGYYPNASGTRFSMIEAKYLAPGQSWVCRVFAEDQFGARSAIVETTAAYVGSPPTPPTSVRLTPLRPEVDDVQNNRLACLVAGATDPDGDIVRYYYYWYREEPLPPGASGDPVPYLPAPRNGWRWVLNATGNPLTTAVLDERWACAVLSTDGVLINTTYVGSQAVFIGNQAPTKPSATVDKTRPKPGDAITCTASSSADPDGDEFDYFIKWYKEVVNELGVKSGVEMHQGAALPVGMTKDGETWYVEVYAIDRYGEKSRASDTVVVNIPTFSAVPPSQPTVVLIEPTVPDAGQQLICRASGSVDANGDPADYVYEWWRKAEAWPLFQLQQALTTNTVPGANVFDRDRWYCVVRGKDASGLYSPAVESTQVLVGNQPPTKPSSVVASPDPAGTVADLLCAASGSVDPNGGVFVYEFEWHRIDGVTTLDSIVAVSAETPYRVEKERLVRGDTWYCRVRANDGKATNNTSDWVNSNAVQIVNLPPTAPTVTIEPEEPTEIDDLLCVATSSADPEGRAVTYRYTWYRNASVTSQTDQRLSASLTSPGETWTCVVQAVDGDPTEPEMSDAVTSPDVNIVSAAPSAPVVSVTPVDANRRTSLTCNAADSIDPFGDEVLYVYRWYVKRLEPFTDADADGVHDAGEAYTDVNANNVYDLAWQESGETGSVVDASALLLDDVWKCAVYTVNTHGFFSATVTSNEVTVANHAPAGPLTVLVVPEVLNGNLTTIRLTVQVSGATDIDGDAITFSYRWQRYAGEGQWTDTGDTSATVDNAIADGSMWRCLVSAADPSGLTSPIVISNAVRLTGTAPIAPTAPTSVTINPATPAAAQELLCIVAGATDVDVLRYLYRWQKAPDVASNDFTTQTDFTQPILPANVTVAGEKWRCEVRARDVWGLESPSLTSAAVTIQVSATGAPTKAVFAQVSPPEPSYASTLQCSEPTGIMTADNHDYTLSYRWWKLVGEAWRPTDKTTRAITVTQDDIGSYWMCGVSATDSVTSAAGPWYTTAPVLIRNYGPSTPSVSVRPQFASLTDAVTCLAAAVDPEDGTTAVLYHYEWFLNGEATGIAGLSLNVLPARYLAYGDSWTCRVYAIDQYGARSGVGESTNSTFVGQAPSVPTTVSMSPSRPEPNDDITCLASGSSDPDGQEVTYLFNWYREDPVPLTVAVPQTPAVMPNNLPQMYWKLVTTGQTLSSAVTNYAERWACLVYATDGTLLSPPVATRAATIGNQPPTRPEISLTPTQPAAGDSITCAIVTESVDPDGDQIAPYIFEWFVFRQGQNSWQSAYVGATLPAGYSQVNEEWYCQVTVNDTWSPSASNIVESNHLVFVPKPPTKPSSVILEPSVPKQGQALRCVASGSLDPNGDAFDYYYTWYRNGVVYKANPADPDASKNNEIAALLVVDGDTWSCSVYAQEAVGTAPLRSDAVASQTVTVEDAKPTKPTTVVVSPTPAGVTEDLVCTAGGSADPNGDTVTYVYQWYRNGIAEPGATDFRLSKTEADGDARLVLGDSWYCEVYATDDPGNALHSTDRVVSNTAVIRDLAPLKPTTASLIPARPTVVDDLMCIVAGATDPENQPLYYSYAWWRNEALTEFSGQIIAAENLAVGQQWRCEVRAIDTANNTSELVSTDTVTVLSAEPSAPLVSVSPLDAAPSDILTCEATESVDPLGGQVAYAYEWYLYRGGVWYAANIQSPSVPAYTAFYGDVWSCAVYAENGRGFRSAAVMSNEVTVVNHVPVAPTSAAIDPGVPTVDGVMTCRASGASDRDGDGYGTTGLKYYFQWQKFQGIQGWVNDGGEILGVLSGQGTGSTVGYDTSPDKPVTVDQEQWRCVVYVKDSQGVPSIKMNSSSVSVAGRAPRPPTAAETQQDPSQRLAVEVVAAGGRLTCMASGFVDPDGDKLLYLFTWYRNGVPAGISSDGIYVAGSYTYTVGANDGFTVNGYWTHSIARALADVGEAWHCEVTVLDARGAVSDPVRSLPDPAPLIVNSRPKTPASAAVAPTQPTTNNDLVVTVTPAAGDLDPDGDDVAYQYRWYKDGTLQSALVGPQVPASALAQTQRWFCDVYARDSYGEVSSSPARSNEVVIGAPSSTDDIYEDDDLAGTAHALVADEIQSRSLPSGDVDWVTLTIPQLAEVRMVANMLADGSCSMRYYQMQQNGTLVEIAPDAGTANGIGRILAPGVYYGRIAHLSTGAVATNPYALQLLAPSARSLGTDVTVAYALTTAVPSSWAYFVLTQQATVTLAASIQRGTGAVSMTLYDAAYTVATAETAPDIITQTLAAGTYYVRLAGSGLPAVGDLGGQLALTAQNGITVQENLAPTAPLVCTVFPETPLAGNTLHCVAYGAAKPVNSLPTTDLRYYFKWYQNGSYREDLSGLRTDADGEKKTYITGANVMDGDTWRCDVYVLDDYGVASPTVSSTIVTVGGQEDWQLEIMGEGNENAVLAIGQKALATNGWDEGIDDVSAPVLDGGPVPAAYLEGPVGDALHTTLHADYRSLRGMTQYWYFRAGPPAGMTTAYALSWDAESLPVGSVFVISEVNAAGEVFPGSSLDMRSTTSISLGTNDSVQKRFVIMGVLNGATYEQIKLRRGWNLISFSLKGIDDSVDNLLAGRKTGSLWYVSGSGVYETATVVQPKYGYWVLAEEPVTVEHVGMPEGVGTVTLHAGWNLVGPVNSCLMPNNAAILANSTYGWEAAETFVDADQDGFKDPGESYEDANGNGAYDAEHYVPVPAGSILRVNRGYWMYSGAETQIELK